MLVFLAAEKNGGSVRSMLDLKFSSQVRVLFFSVSGPREVSVPETAHNLLQTSILETPNITQRSILKVE
jgi:hypothetical protein